MTFHPTGKILHASSFRPPHELVCDMQTPVRHVSSDVVCNLRPPYGLRPAVRPTNSELLCFKVLLAVMWLKHRPVACGLASVADVIELPQTPEDDLRRVRSVCKSQLVHGCSWSLLWSVGGGRD